jgi:hypothetical protein
VKLSAQIARIFLCTDPRCYRVQCSCFGRTKKQTANPSRNSSRFVQGLQAGCMVSWSRRVALAQETLCTLLRKCRQTSLRSRSRRARVMCRQSHRALAATTNRVLVRCACMPMRAEAHDGRPDLTTPAQDLNQVHRLC